MLSNEQIIEAVLRIQEEVLKKNPKARMALIGSALFRLHGLDVDVPDVDIICTPKVELDYLKLPCGDLLASGWQPFKYDADGALLDLMAWGKAGSKPLFDYAAEFAYLDKNGIWCAPLAAACAIKLFAGRDKDAATVEWMYDEGMVERKSVEALLAALTGGCG